VGVDQLNREQRAADITALAATSLSAPLDVLVIGGGVVGCGAALDATSRGLSVGLVEAGDFAIGTSSRSSRLAHGGLRYLEHLEFGLVHEALTERGLLLERLAPHLVRPVEFVFPLERSFDRAYVGLGTAVYHVLSRMRSYGGPLPRPHLLDNNELSALVPSIETTGLYGAVQFFDAQIDDSRHTMALARTAKARGAHLVTGARVVDFLIEQDEITGVVVEVDGRTFPVHALVVVAAVGIWTDELFALLPGVQRNYLATSKGVHLILRGDAIDAHSAVIAKTEKSVLFILPWDGEWLVGTTDTPWEGDLANPTATQDDISYLLHQANRWLSKPVLPTDVVGVYAGLRPLIGSGHDDDTTSISREHVVITPRPGLVAIAGGKYTTYRVMAQDVVNAAAEHLQQKLLRPIAGSTTKFIPLVGADGYHRMWAERHNIAKANGLPVEVVEHLLNRHGDRINDVLNLIKADSRLREKLVDDRVYLWAEVVVAVTHEGARHLSDVLRRRLRVEIESLDAGQSVIERAAELMGRHLGWSETERVAQIDRYFSDVAAGADRAALLVG
jgi:glycerol-3-phosphate dehydrogenase